MPASQIEEMADIKPWDPQAKELIKWHEDEVEDNFGHYKFASLIKEQPKILNSMLEAIGNTPLVKLNRIPEEYGIECNIYGKCEFLNAGGSIKDRIAVKMLEMAEQSGRLKPGMTVIEPTSGNTGIGLALACAIKGYRCIIIMPARMSREKEVTLKALGAEIIRTPNNAHYNSPDSHVGRAFKLRKEIPNSIVLDQYKNCTNPLAHYESTAEEILDALDGKVDMVVIGVGTGGSITGISRKMRKRCPQCIIVGVDPQGSVLSSGTHGKEENSHHERYQVEGIGYQFVPSVLDMNDIDRWEKTEDAETFQMARELHLKEGILCGGSSGAILVGALRAAKQLKKGQNCVFLLPDGARNYLNKFLSDEWMLSNDYMPEPPPQKPLYPKTTFSIPEVYNPESKATESFQIVTKPWKSNPFIPLKRCRLIKNISEAIGNTPIVKLFKLPKKYGIEAEILVKCEFLNAGGSVKDRIARKMIEMAEADGKLKTGYSTVIEPTSGNTGIGLALMCAIRGYRCIIVMPEKMSLEKEVILRSLGAEIVRTPTEKGHSDADSHIGVALRLQKEIPGAIILDQYRNEGNPFAHYEGTAEEILWACDGKLDALVIGTGTGGTLSGVAKRVKEVVPECKIIAVDPDGSILANPKCKETKAYDVEGIGYDFVPAVLDRSLVDYWVKSKDAASFYIARELIKEEGILCGGSAGSNVLAAMGIAKMLGPTCRRVVTIAPDSIRNYMSKFLDDEWLNAKGHIPTENFDLTENFVIEKGSN
uniref:cystathionine beta-synthase n=1 Tax=Meloidogyne incognita TaxID=6306 RepID=A0A914N1I6_MELIC